ncbi:MAG: hypothetical protein AAFP97_11760 [Pseudomonadota bacterium]
MSKTDLQDRFTQLTDIISWLGAELDKVRETSEQLQHAIADADAGKIDPVQLQSLDLVTQTMDNLSLCTKTLAQQYDSKSIDLEPLLNVLTLGELKDRLANSMGLELDEAAQPSARTGEVDLF